MRLTTAYYYTPKGRLIHGVGLEPDIEVEISAEDWRKVQLRRKCQETPAVCTEEDKVDYAGVVDTQLQRAVDMLKAVLIFGRRW